MNHERKKSFWQIKFGFLVAGHRHRGPVSHSTPFDEWIFANNVALLTTDDIG